MAATPAWLASIEALLNRNLQSSQAAALMQRLEGTSLQLELTGLTRIRALALRGKLALLPGEGSPADATLTGSPMALLQLGINSSAGTAAGAGVGAGQKSVQIQGNAEIANTYREVLMLARPDWEEELSRWIGDIPAHQIARASRDFFSWARRAARTAGENLSEYLSEESRSVVNKVEHEEFIQGVDGLRETTDRVEARLQRLEQRAKGAA